MNNLNLNRDNSGENKALYLTIANGLATITLNRAEQGNALNLEMVTLLAEATDEILNNSSVKVILITGTGNNFCVGGDIRAFIAEREQLPAFVASLLEPLNYALAKLEAAKLPIVSALNGAVGGAGIGLALIADYVLAAESMKLRCGYTAIGLSPDAGSSWLLANRVGTFRAKQLFLSNTPLTANECLNLAIVDQVYPDAELMSQVQALLRELESGPRKAMARVKHLLDHKMTQRSFKEQLELERRFIMESASESDVQEGILAFTQKRKPSFS
ncbi:MAG: enoyl-CoA hydratase-related protein [Alcaligenaceae bacterium]|nr:enoyl-CoA hydratase-related protein [Alcaligenaceae bacterium]